MISTAGHLTVLSTQRVGHDKISCNRAMWSQMWVPLHRLLEAEASHGTEHDLYKFRSFIY